MPPKAVPPAWLHVDEHVSPAAQAAVRAALSGAGLAVDDSPGVPDGFGLVVFDHVHETLLGRLHAGGQGSALALAVGSSPPPAEAMWSLLDAGASDVVAWPAGRGDAAEVLARAQRHARLRELAGSDWVRRTLVGSSERWRALVRSVVEVAAFSTSPVLVTGETGTGKDLIARAIHHLGAGAGTYTGELVVLDCTTLSPELAGSELFGHERGAFTGAANPRDGAFALADGGVLFLDEVGELPLPLQAQLLRVIQEHSYKRVGSNSWQTTDFRLVCATNRDLEREVAEGRFRADLYHRIAAWRCHTVPLRERCDDILPLAAHFIAALAPDGRACGFDAAVREFLLARDYPGNVRELRQVVARIWHRHCGPGPLTIGDLPPDERRTAGRSAHWPDGQFRDAVRRAVSLGLGLSRISQAAGDLAIQLVLQEEGDNNQRAAVRLGVTDRALQLRRKAWAEAQLARAGPDGEQPETA